MLQVQRVIVTVLSNECQRIVPIGSRPLCRVPHTYSLIDHDGGVSEELVDNQRDKSATGHHHLDRKTAYHEIADPLFPCLELYKTPGPFSGDRCLMSDASIQRAWHTFVMKVSESGKRMDRGGSDGKGGKGRAIDLFYAVLALRFLSTQFLTYRERSND